MKILYFTGTGNSYQAASNIASNLGITDVERLNRSFMNRTAKLKKEKLVLVFPLYYAGAPKLVLDFLKKVDLSKVKEITAVVTRGSSSGIVDKQLISIVGSKLKGLHYITMPANYIFMYNPSSVEVSNEIITNFEITIKEISKKIKNKDYYINRQADLFRIIGKPAYAYFKHKLKSSDKNFIVKDNCNSCGICTKVCPSNNISLENGKPVWKGNCEECVACIHLCPKESIQYGKKTSTRRRYINPSTEVQMLMNNH